MNAHISSGTLHEIESKIGSRSARVGVIGLGYVGLPLSLLYVGQGFPVTGFDIDQRKVEMLEAGKSYIYRIPEEEIQEARAKRFVPTSDFSKLKEIDAIIICVPTPLDEHHEPDLSFITNTAHAIAPYLQAGQLIILESTTYPGTTEEVLVPILERGNSNGLKAARGGASAEDAFFVAFSPEREDPGNTTVPRHDIPKVVGGLNAKATELACALYGSIFKRTIQVTSPAAAEMTKLLENIYRCVNIAMVNELKLCVYAWAWIFGRSSKLLQRSPLDSTLSTRALDWVATVFQSIRFIFRGRRMNGTSTRDSSNWPVKLTAPCPTTLSNPLGRR